MTKKNIKTGFDLYAAIFYIVLFSAACFRYPYIFITGLWSDEGLYCWFGKQIFLHPSSIFSSEITSWHPPLFSGFLALAHWVFPSFIACHIVPFIFYMAGILAIYHLGKLLCNSFVGVLAAVLLAFNPHYFFISTLVLIDVPLMFFCTLLAIYLFQIEEQSPLRAHLIVGVWGTLCVLLKWSGTMTIPWIFIYYLLSLQGLPLKDRLKKFLIPFSMIFIVIAMFCIKNYLQTGSIKPNGPDINGFGYIHLWEDLKNLFTLTHPLFLIFFVFGIWDLSLKMKKACILLLTWFIVFVMCIFSIQGNDQRFNILFLPPILITIGFGIESSLGHLNQKLTQLKMLKPFIILVVLIFSLIMFFPKLISLNTNHSGFTGYDQAGLYIQKKAAKNTLILAGSERQIRYFSGIDFKDDGGQIVPFRQSITEFKELAQQTPGPIILLVDIWETLQPEWIFIPRIAQKELARDGFKLTKVVLLNFLDNMGKNEVLPVIFIYERPGR